MLTTLMLVPANLAVFDMCVGQCLWLHRLDVGSVVSNSDVCHKPPPLKLLVCQVDAVVVQDAAELMLLDVSFSLAVKQAKHSDQGRQVASNLRGSHTVIDSNSNTTAQQRL